VNCGRAVEVEGGFVSAYVEARLVPNSILLANSKLCSLCAWMPPLVTGQILPVLTRLPGVKFEFANRIELTLKEPALGGHSGCLSTGIDRQLVENRGEVLADGAFGDEEPTADGLT
jgi:hypothetical protein